MKHSPIKTDDRVSAAKAAIRRVPLAALAEIAKYAVETGFSEIERDVCLSVDEQDLAAKAVDDVLPHVAVVFEGYAA